MISFLRWLQERRSPSDGPLVERLRQESDDWVEIETRNVTDRQSPTSVPSDDEALSERFLWSLAVAASILALVWWVGSSNAWRSMPDTGPRRVTVRAVEANDELKALASVVIRSATEIESTTSRRFSSLWKPSEKNHPPLKDVVATPIRTLSRGYAKVIAFVLESGENCTDC